MITEGTFVHSRDPRDDPKTFYVVIETDVQTTSGPCMKIALPEQPEIGYYRAVRLIVSAEAEVEQLVEEIKRSINRRTA